MKIIIIFCTLLCLFSCEIDNISNIQKKTIVLTIKNPIGYKDSLAKNITIKLTNQATLKIYEFKTNDKGYLEAEVEQGTYSISAFSEYSLEYVREQLNNNFITTTMNVSANVSDVFMPDNTNLSLKLNAISLSPIVIKEFYYSGSMSPEKNEYYKDQFIEIFNNSADTIYMDGFCIAEHESSASNTAKNWMDKQMSDSMLVVKTIWMIPGTGKQHQLLPGKGFVLCDQGLNHTKNGNINSPCDLSKADFEWYDNDPRDIDVAGVQNLIRILSYSNTVWVPFVTGGTGLVLFKMYDKDYEATLRSYVNKLSNKVYKISGSGNKEYYPKIPWKYIYDVVEVLPSPANIPYKRFPNILDAGYTYTPSGSYSGKSVRRRISKIEKNNRVVYQDKNNSTDDFLMDRTPKPSINDITLKNDEN